MPISIIPRLDPVGYSAVHDSSGLHIRAIILQNCEAIRGKRHRQHNQYVLPNGNANNSRDAVGSIEILFEARDLDPRL